MEESWLHTMLSTLLIIAGLLMVAEGWQSGDFEVRLDENGNYEVTVGGQPWLHSAPTFFTVNHQHCGTANGCLVLSHTDQTTGWDKLGRFNTTELFYQVNKSEVKVKVMVRWYKELPLVLFGQHYLTDMTSCSHGNRDKVSSGFPHFSIEGAKAAGRDRELGYLAYGGIMTGDTNKHMNIWSNKTFQAASGLDSGPLIIFDKTDNSIIISPFTKFMASSVEYMSCDVGRTGAWGVMAGVDQVPKDYQMWTALMYSPQGVNKLMSHWGEVMRFYYNKERSYTKSDLVNNYIGYWTDNGAYYYYLTEPGMNYQDTIVKVKQYADQLNIPYRYVQYDSWWYPKGRDKGVTEWKSMLSVFPDGLRHMWEKTSWPVVAHNRWWSNYTSYAEQNGGRYKFIVENKTAKAIPVDQRFWDDLMIQSKKWGLITYEQDWLNVEYDEMDSTVTSLTLGDEWLHEMGSAARRAGITVQYCMSPSRHVLTSLHLPAVTQTRVTNDYQPGEDSNWRVGVSSMLADALGLAPYKDNFWTTTHQPGNPYNKSEPYPALNSVIATLTTGPVGPADRVGYSNASLIMRSCNADGLILKPSRPVTAINKQLIMAAYSGFRGEVWSTYSYISGLQFGIVLGAAFSVQDKVSVNPKDVGLYEGTQSMKVYRQGSDKLTDFSTSSPIVLSACTRQAFCLYYSSPVIHLGSQTVVILGELDKWVPMSPQRVTSITVTDADLHITLTGALFEQATLTFQVGGNLVEIACTFGQLGTATLYLKRSLCLGI